jgi:hypothetical protein
MKKSIVLFFILFAAGISQSFSDTIPDDDRMLMKLKGLLPSGWSMIRQTDVLTIQREELVYVLYENMINAPVSLETKEEREQRIIKNGKQERQKYVFSFCPKLSDDEIIKKKNFNDSINNLIFKLKEKHKVKELLDKFASSKGEEYYTAKTDEEKMRIEKYNSEKKQLAGELIRLPEFNTEKYSLYLDMVIGISDEFHLVHPYEASDEMYKVREILYENLIQVK